ncbi:MAG: DUF4249 family protein [Aureispira sp.]
MSRFFVAVFFLFSLLSCEKEFLPETTYTGPQLVVEGYIEAGQNPLPPYVLLTKSTEYSNRLGADLLSDLFVNNARVRISDGVDTVQLQEYCISDLQVLPAPLRNAILQALGLPSFDPDKNIDICVYTDLVGLIFGGLDIREGGRYDLIVEAEGFNIVTATTTIPDLVVVDSLTFINNPNYPANDSLVEVVAHFTDPVGPNFYRLFTKRNEEAFFPASTKATNGSASDDKLFEGRSFSFEIVRGQDPFAEGNLTTFGYFWKGDTVTFRGCNVDYEHFRFWQTIEYNSNSQGPFGTYTRVESNIKGGLGLWGGQVCRDYSIIIPE